MALSKILPPLEDETLIDKLSEDEITDRCLGMLLGCCCGDILGANCEFSKPKKLQKKYKRVHSFLDSNERRFGQYTDDTEMTLAVCDSLIKNQGLNAEHLAKTYGRYFDSRPQRGYGPSVSKILRKISQGEIDYRESGTMIFPEGSYANGGLMRISPIGFSFRNASQEVMHEAVRLALLPTHVHPEAIEGTFLQAFSIAKFTKMNPKDFDADQWINELINMSKVELIKKRLEVVLECLHKEMTPLQVVELVTEPNEFGKTFQIRTADALASVCYIMGKFGKNPEQALEEIVILGGDADTVAAILGALIGSLYGSSWIPNRWFKNIENRSFEGLYVGRDSLLEAGKLLAKLDLKEIPIQSNSVDLESNENIKEEKEEKKD
ncbi:adp-ribose glycohydrolase arh3 [Anaeramoeba ignava]|uniref:ADP-ribosylhydrolase ARH3 n=1 Tax=Anaeramoeba ignava TaxID=1746090 RepID=A0A9Q0R804_ANAIG|nr:adp-ribose glycohydrolase arh3 [Anaeramoeba ignava]